MKILIAGVGILVVMYGVMELVYNKPEVIQKETLSTPEVEVGEEQEIDLVERAQQELERINQELDDEEARLLEEIQQRENRLEQIKETRMSF